jgi:hypothetical protein
MVCNTVQGVGQGLALQVISGGQPSNVLNNSINYAPPTLLNFTSVPPGAASEAAQTLGGDVVAINGLNFGPRMPGLNITAFYRSAALLPWQLQQAQQAVADATPVFKAWDCILSIPHTQV